ncbi:hypothetical protein [Caballeronia glebae]|uniref:hypothetical protein n=1 Tax=Caballeronia glebae TaxID=1777143 RepID=UPI001F2E6F69|nr:hypothetical protein [Caballeronia glebae]
MPPPQSRIARGAAIDGGRGVGRIGLLVERQQFGLAVDAIRIDSFAEVVERRGGRGRRLEEGNAAWPKPQQVRGFRIAGASGENRERIAQRVDQPPGRAHVGAGIAIRSMQLRLRHAVEITAIQREVLPRKTARRTQADCLHRAFCQTSSGACRLGSHLSLFFSSLGRGYQPASNLTRKIATSDKSDYQMLGRSERV